jgi:REP element-mobilizing transposase RayT
MNPDERPPRLKRLNRLFVNHPLYFVTACTEGRKSILAHAEIHDGFRKYCQAGLERGGFVGKYVLMPDHLHLFVSFGNKYELSIAERRQNAAAVCDRRVPLLSEWMKSLKNSLSKTLREMEVPAPHWQKGFFDHLLRSEESYSQKWVYVAENPIRKRLVTRMEDWRYQGEIHPLQTENIL